MLTTAEARDAILAAIPACSVESVPVEQATGRVLRQSVKAERDQPPFDRVMMDGIAISFGDFDSGMRQFQIQAMQAAGDPALTLQTGKAIEIMTGASLPDGADCIVPVERITETDGFAEIEADYTAEQRQFIHARGSDHTKNTELLTSTLPRPHEVMTAMSIGDTRYLDRQ